MYCLYTSTELKVAHFPRNSERVILNIQRHYRWYSSLLLYCTYTLPLSITLVLLKGTISLDTVEDYRVILLSFCGRGNSDSYTHNLCFNHEKPHQAREHRTMSKEPAELIPDYDSSPRKLKPLNASNEEREEDRDAKLKTTAAAAPLVNNIKSAAWSSS